MHDKAELIEEKKKKRKIRRKLIFIKRKKKWDKERRKRRFIKNTTPCRGNLEYDKNWRRKRKKIFYSQKRTVWSSRKCLKNC
jgi:hypothetical protein